jgi:hypothetical protein
MQFALEVAILECSFLNHGQGILGVNNFRKHMFPQSIKKSL